MTHHNKKSKIVHSDNLKKKYTKLIKFSICEPIFT